MQFQNLLNGSNIASYGDSTSGVKGRITKARGAYANLRNICYDQQNEDLNNDDLKFYTKDMYHTKHSLSKAIIDSK